MPNWCTNTLTVIGSEQDLEAFHDAVSEGDRPLVFDRVDPKPENIQGTEQVFWCHHNWGTKWDLDENTHVSYEEDRTVYTYDTAWTAATGIFETLCGQFPNLQFTLRADEPDMEYEVWMEGSEGHVSRRMESEL